PERLVGQVRDVDHHTQPIHLANYLLTEIVKAARLPNLVTRRSGPAGAHAPGAGHVSHTQLVIAPDVLNLVIDRIAALQAHQRGNLSSRGNPSNVIGRRGKFPRLWMLRGQIAHGFDLNIRPRRCARATTAKQLRLDPDGKELRIESTFPCAHRVKLSV